MKVTIETKGKERVIDIPDVKMKEILEGLAKLGIFHFVGAEINRIRPPKRNIGLVLNWISAVAVTDTIFNAFFKKMSKDEEAETVVECESYEEVINGKEETNKEDD